MVRGQKNEGKDQGSGVGGGGGGGGGGQKKDGDGMGEGGRKSTVMHCKYQDINVRHLNLMENTDMLDGK